MLPRIDKTTIGVRIKDFDKINNIIKDCGGTLSAILPYSSTFSVCVREGLADQILKKYKEHPDVLSAEYDVIIKLRGTFHTPASEGVSWYSSGSTKLDYQSHLGRINALHAHNWTTGSGAKVAVGDQGVSYHPDLNLQYSYASVYFSTSGSHFASACAGEEYYWDEQWDIPTWDHGTDCAGLIGCKKNNSSGYCGIAPDCSLFGVSCNSPSVFSPPSCSIQMPALGMLAMTEGCLYMMEQEGVRIFSFSWGSASNTSAVSALCSTIWASGGIVIAAANNDGWDVDNVPVGDGRDYPLVYEHVIGVAASSPEDNIQVYPNASGHVGWGASVDLTVPTSVPLLRGCPKIAVATEPYGYYDLDSYWREDGFAYDDSSSASPNIQYNHIEENLGCSFSAPQVAGIAALIWSIDQSFTNQEVSDILLRSYTKPRGSVNYYTYFTKPNEGCGIADAGKAVKDALIHSSGYSGTIYPSISLYGPGTKWKTTSAGAVETNLSGTVYCDITGYAGSNVNQVELWIDNMMIYQGVAAILTLSCSSSGTPKTLKAVATTVSGQAYETYTDIIVSDITLINTETYGSSGGILKDITNYAEVILRDFNGVLVNLVPITV